jgi:hypothetical protein
MSPAFQETLQGNELLLNAQGASRRTERMGADEEQRLGIMIRLRFDTRIPSNSYIHTLIIIPCDMTMVESALKVSTLGLRHSGVY